MAKPQSAPSTLAECDAETAKNATALAAARNRLPELEEQHRACLLAGDIDGVLRLKAERERLDVEICIFTERGVALAEARAVIVREAAFRDLLKQAADFAGGTLGLVERVRHDYTAAASTIADILRDIEAHRDGARQIAALAEISPHLTKDQKRAVSDALGQSVRRLANGLENPDTFFSEWWLPELVYLPMIAPGEGYFWCKPSGHNENGRLLRIRPIRGGGGAG